MKKNIFAGCLLSLAVLSGCNNEAADRDRSGIYDRNGNTLNVNNDQDLFDKNRKAYNIMTDDRDESFGYVRHQKSPIQGKTISYRDMYTMDREQVADTISRLSVGLPDVKDCATLVTDEEVLVAYDRRQNAHTSRSETADQVKRTAMSVVPRWYHVYVTDDPNLRRDVENLSSMDANTRNSETNINRTINLMLDRSPQGRSIVDGENPNGERIHDPLEDDNHAQKRKHQ